MLKEREGRADTPTAIRRSPEEEKEIEKETEKETQRSESGERNAMKKQSDMRGPTRVSESETVTTNPSSAFTPSRPNGLQDHAHPGHMSRGAAESKASPVSDRPAAAVSSDRSSDRKPR
jgi:hypothetical protein